MVAQTNSHASSEVCPSLPRFDDMALCIMQSRSRSLRALPPRRRALDRRWKFDWRVLPPETTRFADTVAFQGSPTPAKKCSFTLVIRRLGCCPVTPRRFCGDIEFPRLVPWILIPPSRSERLICSSFTLIAQHAAPPVHNVCDDIRPPDIGHRPHW